MATKRFSTHSYFDFSRPLGELTTYQTCNPLSQLLSTFWTPVLGIGMVRPSIGLRGPMKIQIPLVCALALLGGCTTVVDKDAIRAAAGRALL